MLFDKFEKWTIDTFAKKNRRPSRNKLIFSHLLIKCSHHLSHISHSVDTFPFVDIAVLNTALKRKQKWSILNHLKNNFEIEIYKILLVEFEQKLKNVWLHKLINYAGAAK